MMEQPFLGVETQLEPQLGASPQQHHTSSNNQPRVISTSNSTPSVQQVQLDHQNGGKTNDFDLSNPSNPSIATAQALLHNDQRYQHQQPQSQQHFQQQQPPQIISNQSMGMNNSYSFHHLPNGSHLQQMPMNGQQYSQSLPPPPIPHHHPIPSQHMMQQSGYHMEPRYDDNNSNRNSASASFYDKGLVAPIPPLHVQQQLVNGSDGNNNSNGTSPSNPQIKQDPSPGLEKVSTEGSESAAPGGDAPSDQMLRSSCSRCKKEFDQPIIIPQSNQDGGQTKFLAEPKIFKLCQHCRDLQRQRSRRWQKKTKDKEGACRRCGSDIPIEEQRFVLCPSCRQNLRKRKANRAAQGRCVHCSGPLNASIITDEKKKSVSPPGSVSSDSGKSKDRSKIGNYKVCERCRENDKIRRTNLERLGNCNRCAKALDASDIGKHKVCSSCRSRKKKLSQNINTTSNNGSISRLQSIGGGAGVNTGPIPLQGLNGQDPSHGMIAALPPTANLNSQPPMGMISSDMGMMQVGNGSVPYATVPMAQHYTTPQQYAQAQAYNQAVVQQQALSQAIAQAQAQQQQQQVVAAHNARQIQQQQLQQQSYVAALSQQKPGVDDFQSAYASVNQHQTS